jgi:hypothetical protein
MSWIADPDVLLCNTPLQLELGVQEVVVAHAKRGVWNKNLFAVEMFIWVPTLSTVALTCSVTRPTVVAV